MIHTTSIYNGAIQLDFDDAAHRYIVREQGKPDIWPPGVTSILNVINKPALVPWAAKLTAETYSTLVSKKLAAGALLPADLPGIEKESKGAHRAVAKEAAGIGTIVHEWAEQYSQGNIQVMPENPAAAKAVEGFIGWLNDNKVAFKHTEVRVYSRQMAYAGTFDFMAVVNGELVLGDYKTSSGIYPEHHLQTAAYARVWTEMTGEPMMKRLVVMFDKKSGKVKTEMRQVSDFTSDFMGFHGALQVYLSLQRLKQEDAA